MRKKLSLLEVFDELLHELLHEVQLSNVGNDITSTSFYKKHPTFRSSNGKSYDMEFLEWNKVNPEIIRAIISNTKITPEEGTQGYIAYEYFKYLNSLCIEQTSRFSKSVVSAEKGLSNVSSILRNMGASGNLGGVSKSVEPNKNEVDILDLTAIDNEDTITLVGDLKYEETTYDVAHVERHKVIDNKNIKLFYDSSLSEGNDMVFQTNKYNYLTFEVSNNKLIKVNEDINNIRFAKERVDIGANSIPAEFTVRKIYLTKKGEVGNKLEDCVLLNDYIKFIKTVG